VNQRADEIELWEKHLQETRYVGEVGLDAGPRYYRSLEKLKNTFLLAFWSRAQGLAEKFSQYIASALPRWFWI
jgi:Tat protein secretion system quality control protein TatD with DNase activity